MNCLMTGSTKRRDTLLSVNDRMDSNKPGIAQRDSTLTGRTNTQTLRFSTESGDLEIKFEGNPPKWLCPVAESISQLLTLESGWDSYGAKAIEPGCAVLAIGVAIQIMLDDTPLPFVVPMSCGGIQLEWHTRGIDLEIEIRSLSLTLASYEDQDGNAWEERLFDFSRLQRAIRKMTMS